MTAANCQVVETEWEGVSTRRAAAPVGTRRRRLASTVVTLALLAAVFATYAARSGFLPRVGRRNVWSIAVWEGPSPWEMQPVSGGPALSARNVTDVEARCVADPFAIEDNGRWYLFSEVVNRETGQGDIGLSTSPDGIDWTYQQIVLDEPFHVSYPQVFRWEDAWYLVPESEAAGCIRIYQADRFPDRWHLVTKLLPGEHLVDPTLLRRDGLWWMFVGVPQTHDRLRLFYSQSLTGPWAEHPQSPLIDGDANRARPGGPILDCDGQLYRLGQDCDPKYGNALRAYAITRLTATEYAESSEGRLLFQASGSGWNAAGMHHADFHRLSDGRWRAVVDGHRKVWSID